MGCLHDPANAQQTSSKYIQNTRANAGRLLDGVKKLFKRIFHFYARKQNASRVFAIVWASVRLSVCHTRDLYQNGAS